MLTHRSKPIRAVLTAGAAALLVAGSAVIAIPASASASLDAGDERGKASAGKPTDCSKVGADGTRYGKQFVKKEKWADPTVPVEWDQGTIASKALDILKVRDGFEVTAIVVHGGKGYNTYTPDGLGEIEPDGWLRLHAPIGKDKLAEGMDYWFICAKKA